MSGITVLLVMCIVARSVFVASLFAGAVRMWRVLVIAMVWASADVAMVQLVQHLAWTRAAQAFAVLLDAGWM
jgi:hypothetical protein